MKYKITIELELQESEVMDNLDLRDEIYELIGGDFNIFQEDIKVENA